MAELLRSCCSYRVGDNGLDQVAAEKVVKSIEVLNIMKAQPARFVVGLDVVDERERKVRGLQGFSSTQPEGGAAINRDREG